MEQENITEKLIAYIDGKLSIEERADIREWLENDPNLMAEYEQLKQLLGQMDQPLPSVPSERLSQRFDSFLENYNQTTQPRTLNLSVVYRIAASVIVLIFAGGAWMTIKSARDQKRAVVRLEQELINTKKLMLDQMNNDLSASQRMLGVYAANTLTDSDDEIINALANTMETDASSNVRLAAMEALSRFYHEPKVKSLLIQSMTKQKDPVVQIALIQLLVQMKEKSILQDLEKMTHQNHQVKAVKDEAYKGIFKLT